MRITGTFRQHAAASGAELSNLRAAVDWTMTSADDRTLAYELLGKCWTVWMLNGLTGEGVKRMLHLWPMPSNLPATIEANFCVGFARLNKSAAGDEHWEAARRAETLYRQVGDKDGLGLALLLVAMIGAVSDRMSEAEQALREAEQLITDAAAVNKRAPLAGDPRRVFLRRGTPKLAIGAFRRQAELCRSAGNSSASTWRSATWVVPSSTQATWMRRSKRCASRSRVCAASTRLSDWSSGSVHWQSLWRGVVMKWMFFRSRARRSTNSACLV